MDEALSFFNETIEVTGLLTRTRCRRYCEKPTVRRTKETWQNAWRNEGPLHYLSWEHGVWFRGSCLSSTLASCMPHRAPQCCLHVPHVLSVIGYPFQENPPRKRAKCPAPIHGLVSLAGRTVGFEEWADRAKQAEYHGGWLGKV